MSESAGGRGRPTICLCLIVRDEAHVVGELLDSVAGYLDTWVIVDTGSTDGTQQLVRERMAACGVPGELFERPWRDFGSNRSEALALCEGRADYVWMIDADDRVVGRLELGGLVHDGYYLKYGDEFTYWRPQIFRTGCGWHFRGVLHEYAAADGERSLARLEGDYHVVCGHRGARSRNPDKYRHDAELLERAVADDPDNARYWFYLGQSWFAAGDPERARRAYARRATLGGFDEERFYARFKLGLCLQALGRGDAEVIAAFLAAVECRPSRAEPLHALAAHFRGRGQHHLAYLFARAAAAMPLPVDDRMFVHADVYRFRALDELAVNAWYAGQRQVGREAAALLGAAPIPSAERERIARNLELYGVELPLAAGAGSDP